MTDYQVSERYHWPGKFTLCRVEPQERIATDAAGFPRAGVIRIEDQDVLIDDVARFMRDDSFMVLAVRH